MTQPRRAQPADFLVAAVHNASRTALAMAVAAVALTGTGAAVAVGRTHDEGNTAPAAGRPWYPAGTPAPGAGAAPTPVAHPSDLPKPTKTESRAARRLLAAAFRNALAERSVHTVARTESKQFGTATFDNRAAMRGGVQHLRIYGGNVFIRVVRDSTYYSADERGLIRFLRFTPAAAAAFGDRWGRLQRGERGYLALTAGVTLRSTLHEVRIGTPLQLLPERTIDGIRVVGIHGRAIGSHAAKHATATMWVTADDHPLPVQYIETNRSLRVVQTFSEWGEPIALKKPKPVFGERAAKN